MGGKDNYLSKSGVENPFGCWGEATKAAFVWSLGAIVSGVSFTVFMSRIDHWMYTNNAEVLDYRAYGENRSAFSSITVERKDPRAAEDLAAVYQRLVESATE